MKKLVNCIYCLSIVFSSNISIACDLEGLNDHKRFVKDQGKLALRATKILEDKEDDDSVSKDFRNRLEDKALTAEEIRSPLKELISKIESNHNLLDMIRKDHKK